MRISDWSSDVCSSDLLLGARTAERHRVGMAFAVQQRRQDAQSGGVRTGLFLLDTGDPAGFDAVDLGRVEARLAQHVGEPRERRVEVGRASCWERGGQAGASSVVGAFVKKKE